MPIPGEWKWFPGGFLKNGETQKKIAASQIGSFASFAPPPQNKKANFPPPPTKQKLSETT